MLKDRIYDELRAKVKAVEEPAEYFLPTFFP
jgi:hypothetical protein